MTPKHDAEGRPNVVHVQDLLDSWPGRGAARLILPITAPYVVHHGALGASVTACLPESAPPEEIARRLAAIPGI